MFRMYLLDSKKPFLSVVIESLQLYKEHGTPGKVVVVHDSIDFSDIHIENVTLVHSPRLVCHSPNIIFIGESL